MYYFKGHAKIHTFILFEIEAFGELSLQKKPPPPKKVIEYGIVKWMLYYFKNLATKQFSALEAGYVQRRYNRTFFLLSSKVQEFV